MVDEKVKRLLLEFNQFWQGKFSICYKERDVYSRIKRLLKEPQIIALCGLRRVGKTTLLRKYKIIVSGSGQPFLRKGARKSLAGRFHELEILGLTFAEYLGFVGKEAHVRKPQLFALELKKDFEGYLLSGSFPELIGKKEP